MEIPCQDTINEIPCHEDTKQETPVEKPKPRKRLTVPLKDLPAVKKEIRKDVPKLTIPHVLRRFGDPYDALLNELYSEGCLVCVHYVEFFILRERMLLEDQTIRYQVKDDSEFLYALIDNIKNSEKVGTLGNDRNKAMDILLKLAETIESKGEEYSWLLFTYFITLKAIVSHWNGREYNNSKCKVFFKYGKILSDRGKKFSKEAIEKLSQALSLSRGSSWSLCMDKDNFLHQEIASLLATVLLREADDNVHMNPEISAQQAKQAVLVLSEDGSTHNKDLHIEANLKKIRFLIYSKSCEEAQSSLTKASPYVMMSPKIDHKCEFYLLFGIVNYCLKNYSNALRKVKKSLKISEIYDLKKLQAEGNLYLGKILSEDTKSIEVSESCFLKAKELYEALNDAENIRKANYLIGNHQALSVFGSFVRHLNNADIDFCHKFRLQQWKSMCVPFWTSEDFDIDYEAEKNNRQRNRPSLLDRDCLIKNVF